LGLSERWKKRERALAEEKKKKQKKEKNNKNKKKKKRKGKFSSTVTFIFIPSSRRRGEGQKLYSFRCRNIENPFLSEGEDLSFWCKKGEGKNNLNASVGNGTFLHNFWVASVR